MLPILITYLLFSIIFLYVIPTSRSRVLGVMYLFLILFFIWGIGGLLFAGNPTDNEKYVFYAFYMFILGIHIPLFIKMSQINSKKEVLKLARKFLEDDVKHLTDKELHYRIKHE